MKAIRIHAFGGPENLIHEDVPEPTAAAGEVVVAVAAAGVNPADYKFRNGLLAEAVPKLPFVPGMDIAGRIVAVGDGVTGWTVGDRVLALLQLMGNGAYQDRVAVPAEWCAPLPPDLDDITAAALPTPAVTAMQWIEDGLNIAAGDRVLVTGAAGAVGRIACYAAKARGARVTAIVRPTQVERVAYADEVITFDDAVPAGGSFDAIADTVGGELATRLLPSLKAGGVLSTVATDPVSNPTGHDVTVGFFGNHADADVLARAAQAVASGALTIPAPTTMPLCEAAAAHRALEQGGAGKIVLLPHATA